MTDEARAIREFWFGELPLTPQALSERMQFWFGEAGAPQDGEIRTRFGTLIERAAGGELASWAGGPRRRLSLILLLDQFPRNVFRGTARAFAGDEQALALALSGMQCAADAALDPVERLFFYMPLQHAERLEAQDEALAAYRRLLAEVPEPFHATFAGALHAAEQHRAIIERFGRFPHRNLVLERVSTAAEEQWLRENPNHFGQ
ncbi:MAG TPA: DUF924 family protein [Steroidobacteraceae bacterium]|jgi:uncharacterized protein (DUF924 family)|nr:DUF924 family protein [Steroidobacteraceae bacterium]